jgi:hypothetical protein
VAPATSGGATAFSRKRRADRRSCSRSDARAAVEGYGIGVYFGDVPDPNTGTFDGLEIGIDFANDLDTSLFVLAHLFGHTVQWNTVPAYRTIDHRARPGAAPEVIEEARVYERNASRLALSLLHGAGITDRDQWLADWWASDWRYLSTFYATGKLPVWASCRVTGQPLLEPLAIPEFTPQRFNARYAF